MNWLIGIVMAGILGLVGAVAISDYRRAQRRSVLTTRVVVRVQQPEGWNGPGCTALFTDGTLDYSTKYCLLQPGDSAKVPVSP